MSILSSLRVYRGKWNVKNVVAFSSEDINAVAKAEVVASDFGLSVCLFLKDGGLKYMPVSNSSRVEVNVGDVVNLSACNCVTLGREGDDDIYRIEING